jgi:NADH-quinone oxidoreductase subunit L
MIMILPLIVLAIGAIFAGYINWPGHGLGEFLGRSPSFQQSYKLAIRHSAHPEHIAPLGYGQVEAEHLPLPEEVAAEHSLHLYMMIVSGLISIAGIGLAYLLHLKNRAAGDALPEKFGALARLLEAKYWVDEIYQAAFVEPLRRLGQMFFAFDRFVIDGLVWTISFIPQASGFAMKLTTQRGYLQGYASAMLFGIAAILLAMFL